MIDRTTKVSIVRLLKISLYSLVLFGIVVAFGADGIWHAERNAPGATILTYEDAVWWTINVCSVGDATVHPVTSQGRFISIILILLGYSFFTVNIGIAAEAVRKIVKVMEEWSI